MKKLIVLFVGLALVTAGCGTAMLDAGPADTATVLPGGVDFAADGTEAYQLEAPAGYMSQECENDDSASGFLLGITYYFMGEVDNDETPIGLQPVVQMASDVSLDLTIGTYDSDGLDEDDSIFGWLLSARYIMGEDMVPGLGFEFEYGNQNVGEDATNVDDGIDTSTLGIGALYYVPQVEGLIAKLGYVKTEADADGDTDTTSGIELGAEYYMEVSDGIWIDAELTLGFLNREVDDAAGDDDDDAMAFAIRADVYPMKVLGIGITYASQSQDDSDWEDADQSSFEIHASYSFDEQGLPLDINISYTALDIEADDADVDTIAFTVDYRF